MDIPASGKYRSTVNFVKKTNTQSNYTRKSNALPTLFKIWTKKESTMNIRFDRFTITKFRPAVIYSLCANGLSKIFLCLIVGLHSLQISFHSTDFFMVFVCIISGTTCIIENLSCRNSKIKRKVYPQSVEFKLIWKLRYDT